VQADRAKLSERKRISIGRVWVTGRIDDSSPGKGENDPKGVGSTGISAYRRGKYNLPFWRETGSDEEGRVAIQLFETVCESEDV
jgi:hypothetical protein